MKRIAKYFLVTLGLLIGFTVNAHSVQAATLNQSYSDYWYYRANGDGSNAHSWHYTLYEVDGETAYCIEPNVEEGTYYTLPNGAKYYLDTFTNKKYKPGERIKVENSIHLKAVK